MLSVPQRFGSAAAAAVLGGAAWVALATAGLGHAARAGAPELRAVCWVLGGVFALNTLGNLASPSHLERIVMTPVTLLQAACFVVLARA